MVTSDLLRRMVAVPKTLFLHAHSFFLLLDYETSILRHNKNFALCTPRVTPGPQAVET